MRELSSKPNKKVVIAGSASLQEKVDGWKQYWNTQKGYTVIKSVEAIDTAHFQELYPKVHKEFFRKLLNADILFVANEDKKGIEGYIGAEVFAELVFAMMQRLVGKQKITVILAKMPSPRVQSYEEIVLWLKLGWIRLL